MSLLDYISQKKERLIYPQMGAFGLPYTNYSLYEVYADPQKQLEMAMLLEDKIPLDFSYPLDYGAVFVEALGVPLARPPNDFPSVIEHPVRDFADLERLKPPNPQKDGLMPVYLESIRLIRENIDKPQMVSLEGPCTLAGELMGIEDMARSVIKRPGFFAAVLDFAGKIILDFLSAAVASGARVIQISEPIAALLSAGSYARFIQPRLKKIFAAIRDAGAWGVLHICGETTRLLPQMIQSGAEALSLDQIMNMPKVARAVPANIILCGNIDPVEVIYQGTPQLVREATSKLLAEMEPYRNFMPSLGCDCVIGSPEDNVKAFIDTVRMFK